jgi:two-component system phosphate regulon sensor histidine kinase PhoR
MKKKIFGSIMLIATTVLIASFVIIIGYLYTYFSSAEKQHIKDELNLACSAVELNGIDYLEKVESHRYRLTWIDAEGLVLYDSVADAKELENHADRAEFIEAMAYGEGESSRYSSTLLEKQMYVARRLKDGSVLRISIGVATVGHLVLGMLQPFVTVLAVALLLSLLFANYLSKRIVEPLNKLDLDSPLENEGYDEIAPLLVRLNQQRLKIDAQMRNLRRHADEFRQITASMREGLVLMDTRGTILSINPAAQRLFRADEDCVGEDFLTVDRDPGIIAIVKEALATGHGEMRAERSGQVYQFDVSRIESEGEPIGAVLIAFDITETERAERHRREFTANVSHELKTPLQGIIGSAELIERDMVRPEDMQRFVGHIRNEAQRMVTLIGDVIRLSQLEEGADMPVEPIDLFSLVKEVARDLEDLAQERGVDVAVKGESFTINGVRLLLYEAVSNLIDNAIKYNVEKGSVRVKVTSDNDEAKIVVRDTGTGIASEHLSRIFERFYRVDRSHSKASGGTGLGLSIVKHAVQYHGGKVDIESEPDHGTEITLIFPLTNHLDHIVAGR